MPSFALSGRRALVTGSSEGIGQAIAVALAAAGAEVVAHGLEPDGGAETLRDIAALGGTARYLAVDLADVTGAAFLLEQAGPVDILVSTVAMQIAQPLGAIGRAEIDRQCALNIGSAIALIQDVLPHMRENGWGRVVTIGSVQEARPHPHMLVYAAFKAAQVNLVQNIARQVAADGVTVNNVAPGVILTRRNDQALANEAYAKSVMSQIPVRRFGTPDDVAGAVLLLCSDAGAYITGASVPVDGGMYLA